ncbi:MAG: ATP-binding protein [Hydrogenoanaerobacterium sp.]
MDAKIKVSGNIISELSDKIPSNIIAINELIKNAYDAGAPKVLIKLDQTNKLLTITDDGSGMDKSDIDKLFHISNSEKRYGKINQYDRITQGAKGLGFLSVFKFGGQVTWKTKKADKGFRFSADLAEIVKIQDVSEYSIEIIDCPEIPKGTTIEINIDDYNLKTLTDYFSDEKNYQKVVNSFFDSKFIIELVIGNRRFSNINPVNLKSQLPEKQILYVTYDSDTGDISFNHKGCKLKTEHLPTPSPLYKIKSEIMIFSFAAYDKGKIDKLFFNPSDALTPLIYVNSNIFNNYTLFDPNIMQTVKKSYVLAQMIGFININSADSMMNFNSDRTQFLQNQLTDEITIFLSDFNKAIQEIGSKLKKQIDNRDYLTVKALPYAKRNATEIELQDLISNDYEFKSKVLICKKSDKVEFSIFGSTISIPILPEEKSTQPANGGSSSRGGKTPPPSNGNRGKSVPAFIKLKQQTKRIQVNSPQIDLILEIDVARDSNAQNIPTSSIEVRMDGVTLTPPILNSISAEKMIKIEFRYTDPTTGPVSAMLTIEIYQPVANMDAQTNGDGLFMLPTNKEYTLNIDNTIANLFTQLKKLSVDDYLEVIACCVRPIFEISIDSLQKSGKFSALILRGNNLVGIVNIVEFITSDNKFLSAISNKTGIDYNSLKNLITVRNFEGLVDDANLGAHKSTMYIKEVDIRNLIHKMKFFLVVVNEMLTNPSIT